MMTDAAAPRLSVRAVAARAGVSTGTLRHFFPTQRELLDTVLRSVYETALPDAHIHDSSLPARARLVECLRQLLATVGSGDEARATWDEIHRLFLSPAATDESRAGYAVLALQAQRRVEFWLAALVEEGALAPGDNSDRARFLITVVNGLSLDRALPADGSVLESETRVLGTAVDAVLAPTTA